MLVGPAAPFGPLVTDVGVAHVVVLAPTLLVEAVGGVLLLTQVEGEAAICSFGVEGSVPQLTR